MSDSHSLGQLYVEIVLLGDVEHPLQLWHLRYNLQTEIMKSDALTLLEGAGI